ncbi:hypothetical protein SO802_023040 [Lithocarpus litseifolius]|uniref:Uncharacterized protein n=1 Tax=Lithocarpus litseifolius TaxID=425828 RepID=A0AAW2C6Z7_9ROSI
MPTLVRPCEDEDEPDNEAFEGDWDMYVDGVGSSRCSGFAHEDGCIFVPTLGRPTPPIVQANPTQEPSLLNPNEPVAQIEQIRSENIEPIHGLRRSLRTDIHPLGCGTDDGKIRPAKAAVRKRQLQHDDDMVMMWGVIKQAQQFIASDLYVKFTLLGLMSTGVHNMLMELESQNQFL